MKKTHRKVLTLDQFINSNLNYEYLRSCLTSHTNKKLKIKKTINQTDLVPITFGVLISKEKTPNSESKTKWHKSEKFVC